MQNDIHGLRLVKSGIECLHLIINIFIFCHVIIWNNVTSKKLQVILLNAQSHAAKDNLYQSIQKYNQMQQGIFPILNNVIELVLVLNVLVTVARLTFF